jgi:LmbE family N-acetylglucosaminyl deacetylase
LGDADAALVPGYPLDHPDHRWVGELVLSRTSSDIQLGLYVEQPYAAWHWLRLGRLIGLMRAPEPKTTSALVGGVGKLQLNWQRSRACLSCRRRKFAALGAYRSQLKVLRRWPRARIALYEMVRGGESIAWLDGLKK